MSGRFTGTPASLAVFLKTPTHVWTDELPTKDISVNAPVSATMDGSLPLVTMVMLAFNQQAYIEQAIDGALSQDYPNLEIVFSDDCSSDATFDIIQRGVCEYRGPHRLIANQTPSNLGILGHLYNAVGKSSGALIVVAAGDDISIPTRVSTLVEQWRWTGAAALSSEWFVMDDQGTVKGTGNCTPQGNVLASWFADGQLTMVTGPTAAYDRGVFEAIATPNFTVLAEDAFFSLILGIRSQKVVHVAEPLVKYRVHSNAIINRPLGTGDDLAEERRLEGYAAMAMRMYQYVLQVARTGTGVDPEFGTMATMRWTKISERIDEVAFRSRWIDAPLWQRILVLARPPYDKAKLRWWVPRVGGMVTLRLQRRLTAAYRRRR